LGEVPHTWVEWNCSQLFQNTPFHPITEWSRQRFGGAEVPAEQRLTDLENSLVQVKLDPVENLPLLAPLLDIPLPVERVSTSPPEELRRRQLAAVTTWALAGARVQPIVLAVEDVHWADPTTQEVLRGIAERGALARLFVVITARPEFRPPWSIRSHHGTISLAPLDRAQVRDMVTELSARHALPHEVVEDVAARTGGVPLFVEEVTRLLLERGGEQGGIHAIPPTLQQSLMARLDRLGPAREVAQIGAVIGRGFSYALLRAVAGMDDVPLQAALERLADADIVLVQGLPPESDYRFKHALIQDAAYENLLKSQRQVLHLRVAEILRDFAATAAAEPEVLAHHFTQAGLTDAAIEWWGKAGDRALRRFAFKEAITHFGKATEMADRAAEDATLTISDSERLRFQTAYGQALLWARGHTAADTRAAFARAQELASKVGDTAERFPAYYGLWAGSFLRGEIAHAQQMAARFLREVEEQPQLPEAFVGHRIFGVTSWYVGNHTSAHDHFQKALNLYDPTVHSDFANRFGQNNGISAGYFDALALYPLGHIDQALRRVEQAERDAKATAHVPTLVQLHYWKFLLGAVRREPDSVMIDAETFLALVSQHDLPSFVGYATFIQGWMSWERGERGSGRAQMLKGISLTRDQGLSLCLPFFEVTEAEAEVEGGELKAGLDRLDRALSEIEHTGERWYEAEMHRIRGEMLLTCDRANAAVAEQAFQVAIEVAEKQAAQSFKLRGAISIARLWRDQGKRDDAGNLLAPVYGWFSEGFDTRDLKEAKALLEELAA
jgi:predicted ATPase